MFSSRKLLAGRHLSNALPGLPVANGFLMGDGQVRLLVCDGALDCCTLWVVPRLGWLTVVVIDLGMRLMRRRCAIANVCPALSEMLSY